jgi:hypothetical protein
MIFLFIGTWVVIGLAAGSYPAFVLASFKPASILKTTLAGTGRGLTLRTIIVIVQFTLAVILLIGTGVIYSQLHYIQTTDRGFDSDNLLSLRMNRDLASKYEQFRTLVASNPAIKTITQTSATPDMVWSVMRGINWKMPIPPLPLSLLTTTILTPPGLPYCKGVTSDLTVQPMPMPS